MLKNQGQVSRNLALQLKIQKPISIAALNVEAILNLELEPKVKPMPLPSPTFPIPGSSETREIPLSNRRSLTPESNIAESSPPNPPVDPPSPPPPPPPENFSLTTKMETDDVSLEEDSLASQDGDIAQETSDDHPFYTPDEEDEKSRTKQDLSFEEAESVSYVPPFNNPVYPNDNFTAYTSTIGE